ncbi:MAG: C1 family peptidase [Pseudomonadota bacterium]
MIRTLGYRPDPPKAAGQKPDLNAQARLRAEPIPQRADNRHLVLSVLDQGGIGSCVAQAVMQAVRASQVKHGAVNPPLGSRLWTYYLSRAISGETDLDAGTFIRQAFAAIVKFGFPPESAFPYSDQNESFKLAPGPEVYRQAFDQRQPTEYYRIFEEGPDRVLTVKRALAQGHLVVFGTSVSNRFCGDDLGRGPVMPPAGEPIAGGHAMTLVGYDGDAFDVVNSWGTGWGDGGFWAMSASYLSWDQTRDLWICRSAPNFSGGKS